MSKVSLWFGLVLMVWPMLVRGGDPRLASVFSDHMVLQREKPVRIWGYADPETKVEVAFDGQRKATASKADGSWEVTLDPMPASSESRDLKVSTAGGTATLSDILVGEVWLLGGQSNMEMPLWWRGDSDGMKNAKDTRLVLGTDHPWLRIMTVPQGVSRVQQNELLQGAIDGDGVKTGQWFIAKEKDSAISGFSALGYFLGVQMHEKLGVPIGLIDTSWGGTIASAWNSRESLDEIPEASAMIQKKEAAANAWTEIKAREEHETLLADWEIRAAAAKAENKPIPGKPEMRPDPGQDRNFPAGPFNAMIWPLRHLAIRGVFFYQGENNYFDYDDPFAKTFPGVITSWRNAFESPELPFCIFQICGWERADVLYFPTKLPIIQEWQHRAHLMLPNTGFVVTMDYPHEDIHPMVKRVIAERAMRWARAEVYGEIGLTWGTPRLKSYKRDGAQILLSFDTFGDEAILLKGEPSGLVIAGSDGKFVEAKARVVQRTSLAVWSDQVPEPMVVRYAWSQRAVCRLFSASGLPIGPFRTDEGEIPRSEIRD
ncbi:MAG: hypothetical protein ACK52S_06895 [Pirellula sp.]|jgi:sialate O-acetylesterase